MNPHFITRPACPACGASGAPTLFARPYAEKKLRAALKRFYLEVGQLDYEQLLGADYVVQMCRVCGLAFQRDVPDSFLLGKLYEEWISPPRAFARFHAHVSPGRCLEIGRDVFVSLSLVSPPVAPRRALDYGCGWGEWGRMTQAFGAETWGTELSAARRAACQREGIRVVVDHELPDAGFDLINADQVFEHLPAPAETLGLLARKLRPGGVIRIAVPNGWRIRSSLARFDRELQRPRLGGLNAIAPLEHLNGFSTGSLVRMAANSGLMRVIPSWRILHQASVRPPGLRAKLKAMARPFYLRSRWTTQLWFAPARAAR